MEFGNYWEQSYLSEWDCQREDSLRDYKDTGGPVSQRVWSGKEEPLSRLAVTEKEFKECDIRGRLDSCTFTRCKFIRCRFVSNIWRRVKFSGCEFTRCHFLRLRCEDCEFLDDCRFEDISASAEYLTLNHTALSASAFLSALRTNLRNLPAPKDALKQMQRFSVTRRKIAGIVFRSATEAADPLNIAAAYRNVVLSALAAKIMKRHFYYDARSGSTVERWRLTRFVLSLGARCEYAITWVSGWLTDWGQSLLRSTAYIVVVILVFACIYYRSDPRGPGHGSREHIAASTIKSTEISLLFGYTTHRQVNAPLNDTGTIVANAIAGLYWYSLVVGAITKRTLQ